MKERICCTHMVAVDSVLQTFRNAKCKCLLLSDRQIWWIAFPKSFFLPKEMMTEENFQNPNCPNCENETNDSRIWIGSANLILCFWADAAI